MFGRGVSFHLKPGCAVEFTRLLDTDIISVLKQKGFQDEVALVASDPADAVGGKRGGECPRRVSRCTQGARSEGIGHASGADS